MKVSNKNICKPYEENLRTATYANYSSNIPRFVAERLEAVYFDETGINLHVNASCGNCVLDLLRKVGKLYFNENG